MTTNLNCYEIFLIKDVYGKFLIRGHNRQWFTHVTKFMKYIVHGWDAQCRELSEGLRPPCNLSFSINELQYFAHGCFPMLGFYHINVGVLMLLLIV